MQPMAVNPWVRDFLTWTEQVETSPLYLTWVGYATLSAIIGRRIYSHLGFTTIYPNLFIILVGPSGGARKGEAMKPAKRLIESTDTILCPESVIRGSSSA